MADFPGETISFSLFNTIAAVVDSIPVVEPFFFQSSSAGVIYYKMIGRDSGCGTPTYVAWVVTNTPDFTGAQAGLLPCGGPLLDIYLADKWT